MKKPEIKECNLSDFNRILEQKSVARFSVPSYQRGYSWDTKNWKWFWQSAKKLIEKNKRLAYQEEKEIWFIGNIILQEEQDNAYSIVDGQQRLITIFILLSVIYKYSSNMEIKNQITNFLLCENKLRIELDEIDNPFDKESFERTIFSTNLKTWNFDEIKEGRDNISRANNFFTKSINYRNCGDVYQTIINNFYFSLMIVNKEADAGELFMALNKTALDLTVADLVRSLFIANEASKEERQRISQIWNEKIVKKVCASPENSSNYKKSQEIFNFLIRFREAKFGDVYHSLWGDKTQFYEFFEKKANEDNSIFDWMVEYAEVYNHIVVKNDISWWKEKDWPSEIFYLTSDLMLLDYRWLVSPILAVYFKFNNRSEEEKEKVIKDLRSLLLFAFRMTTVKGRQVEAKPLWAIRETLLKNLAKEDNGDTLLLGHEKWFIRNNFDKEFVENFDNFYNEDLKRWQPLQRYREKVWKFIMSIYYWKKIIENNEIEKNEKEWIRKEMVKDYDIEYLEVAHRENPLEMESFKNNLGNITLLKGTEIKNKGFFKWDSKKRFAIKNLERDCLMNYLEKNWTDIEDIRELVEKRKRYLLEDFKRLRIFEKD
ncbi:DUF262 domain-containing protein [endosymbiont GvMRE of Glomus versiforme]|uniref:DUF262 domain-containing protein n=1 Tax=endosymbiont GvMRE of Glomus versiforme TaxID=2039283 RepID=UPI000EDEA4AA|nr:DUF262 domain-containing protein [endosymbiont GvMRE of Glomus versiforme]RHZ36975.1 RloF [endosymbiont GvMRE of Glomus versiforme]